MLMINHYDRSGNIFDILSEGEASNLNKMNRENENEDACDGCGIFDDDELFELIQERERDKAAGNTISLEEVKRRLNYPD